MKHKRKHASYSPPLHVVDNLFFFFERERVFIICWCNLLIYKNLEMEMNTNRQRVLKSDQCFESGKPMPWRVVGKATNSMLPTTPMATGSTVSTCAASSDGTG